MSLLQVEYWVWVSVIFTDFSSFLQPEIFDHLRSQFFSFLSSFLPDFLFLYINFLFYTLLQLPLLLWWLLTGFIALKYNLLLMTTQFIHLAQTSLPKPYLSLSLSSRTLLWISSRHLKFNMSKPKLLISIPLHPTACSYPTFSISINGNYGLVVSKAKNSGVILD